MGQQIRNCQHLVQWLVSGELQMANISRPLAWTAVTSLPDFTWLYHIPGVNRKELKSVEYRLIALMR